jgi:predicted DNA-binding transcriptional regulator YafY
LSEAGTPKRLRALGDRRGTATHATGVRCAQLVDGLYGRPLGWSLEAAAAELNVSVRSVERYAIPFVEKHYRHLDDTVDRILRGLIEQRRLRIDYGGTRGAGRVHAFDPYTLAVYRGGLYLIGRSDRYEKIIYLAVEPLR